MIVKKKKHFFAIMLLILIYGIQIKIKQPYAATKFSD